MACCKVRPTVAKRQPPIEQVTLPLARNLPWFQSPALDNPIPYISPNSRLNLFEAVSFCLLRLVWSWNCVPSQLFKSYAMKALCGREMDFSQESKRNCEILITLASRHNFYNICRTFWAHLFIQFCYNSTFNHSIDFIEYLLDTRHHLDVWHTPCTHHPIRMQKDGQWYVQAYC